MCIRGNLERGNRDRKVGEIELEQSVVFLLGIGGIDVWDGWGYTCVCVY